MRFERDYSTMPIPVKEIQKGKTYVCAQVDDELRFFCRERRAIVIVVVNKYFVRYAIIVIAERVRAKLNRGSERNANATALSPCHAPVSITKRAGEGQSTGEIQHLCESSMRSF